MTIATKPTAQSSAMIAARLADAIHEHRRAPGMKRNDDEVVEVYGGSRTVVRAALQKLAHMHLVAQRPNKGAFVAKPTVKEAREVFEARAMMEPRMTRYAAARATPEDIARLDAHIQNEHAAIKAGENGRALQLSGSFTSISRNWPIRTPLPR